MGLGKKTIDDENYAGKRVQRLSCAAIWASRRTAPKPSSAWLPLLFA